MKITGGRIARFLDNPPENIIGILFFGPDRGLVKERAAEVITKWSDNPDDAFSNTILTSDDLQSDPAKLSDEISAMSLLGDRRLIRLRLDHEKSGSAVSKLIKTIDERPDIAAARLVVEAGEMTTRSAIRKAFEAAANFSAIGCYPDSLADIANLVRRELSAMSINIEPQALDLWVPRLEGDRAMARGEMEKMILYKGAGLESGAVVTVDDVKTLSSNAQSSSLDEIVQAIMTGQATQADNLVRRAIAAKLHPAMILRALQRQITRLLEAKINMSSGQTAQSAMKSLRPPVFRMHEKIFLTQLNRWSERALKQALSLSLQVEEQVKSTGSPVNTLIGRLTISLSEYAARMP